MQDDDADPPKSGSAQTLIAYTRAILPGLKSALTQGLPSNQDETPAPEAGAQRIQPYPHEDVLRPVPPPVDKAAPPDDGSGVPAGGVDEVVVRARPGRRVGDLSMRYETGYAPGQEDLAAGTVSTGRADPGGVSYGAPQLSSLQGQPQAFLAAEGKPFAARFAGLNDWTNPNGKAAAAWKKTAQSDPENFFADQHAYIQRTHYDPLVATVKRQTGLDINTRSNAVQQAAWSMAVNHGRAPTLVAEAVSSLNGVVSPADPAYDRALINKMYDVREDYVHDKLPFLLVRYKKERQEALGMLEK